jgi:protein-S-isoprenylcysteine O-methyltransferase Ste14
VGRVHFATPGRWEVIVKVVRPGHPATDAICHLDVAPNSEPGSTTTVYRFRIALLLGFVLAGASTFTAAYSRRWGERGGQLVTSILRNFLGIPLWLVGFILAWRALAPRLLSLSGALKILAWLLCAAGLVPVMWGHLRLGWRNHMPSVRDALVHDGLYARVRHPIYSVMMLVFVGLAWLRPTATVVVACTLGFLWLIVQARLEELDLVQRLPAYREYME